MAFLYKYLFLFFTCNVYAFTWFSEPIISHSISPSSSSWFSISSSDGFFLVSPDKSIKKKIKKTLLYGRVKNQQVFLNGESISQKVLYIFPLNQSSVVEGKQWSGPLTLYSSARYFCLTGRKDRSLNHLTIWQQEKKEQPPVASYKVRVLLEEKNITKELTDCWTLFSEKGFIIQTPDKKKKMEESVIQISHKQGKICINNQKYDNEQLFIISKSGCACVYKEWYQGIFIVHKTHSSYLLINYVDLEEYIYAVLKTESWPGWPLEFNKALAIACRSYAMAMIRKAHKKNAPYHIKNTTEHQTYKGVHNTLVHRMAVEQTRGLFLAYQGLPALTMFDCCCGGVVTAHMDDYNFEEAPYLARSYPCTHCKRTKIYSWKKEFKMTDLCSQLRHFELDPVLKEIKIAKKDKAGLVKEMELKGAKKAKTLSGKQFYQAIKDIKSYYFSMTQKGDSILFTGRGYGHHLGMCQWGAKEMVEDGWSHKQILQFYYPGTQFMRLSA